MHCEYNLPNLLEVKYWELQEMAHKLLRSSDVRPVVRTLLVRALVHMDLRHLNARVGWVVAMALRMLLACLESNTHSSYAMHRAATAGVPQPL